ncbi:MAG: tetratricopeptide repeat protein [Vicinamibacteria bacterium]|nr:tetratricopeptide repeat protein [Vicinamibacteria bacterium]
MASNFRTCPQCSTRNRLDKEFCVKCGEPLEGVKAGDPAAVTAKKGKPGFLVSEERDEAQSPLVPLVFVALTVGVAFAGWRAIQNAEATTPTPLAAPPVAQASLPPVGPSQMSPGVQAYTAGMAALRASDYVTATRLLREAIAAANKADYRLGLAEALEKSGFTNDALAEYETAAGIDTVNVRFTSEWAKALNRAGRNTEAVRVYDAALQIDPENLANLREVASLHLRANDLARARPYLERIVRLQPEDLTPKQNLARALEATRDLDGAAKQYREILAVMPDAEISRALLSDVLMKQSQPDQALQLLEEGLKLDANSPILHREKGRILDRQGDKAGAVAAYQQYVRLAPGATDISAFTARIEQLSSSLEQ